MKAKVVYFLFMTVLCIFGGYLLNLFAKDYVRLKSNQTALFDEARYYRTRDSFSAASVQQMTLKHAEFEKHYAALASVADDLNLKIKRLETASRTVTNTVVEFVPVYRDSIVFRDGRIDTLRCATYNDAWVSFEYCDDTAHVAVTDTLIQFVHRVPRQWWFIRFGTKSIRQEVTTKNPHAEITYTEYINLIRR